MMPGCHTTAQQSLIPPALHAGSTFVLPKQALHSSIYAASSPEEVDIIDPSAMSNTPSPTGG